MVRDDHPITITSALDILICTEGGIRVNCQSSTYENIRGRGGRQHKERMGHTFTQQKRLTEDNATLVSGKDEKTLNNACYNCRKPGHLA